MNKTSEYRRRRGSGTGIGAEKSSVYMNIEAVVGGDLLTVASVIPEQYSLKKLWADIRDLCFDQPIKHATERLYRAKNKALEFLGQDHKASYTKLFRYMHAIIASNPGSTVSLDKDWMGGGVSPHFKIFFVFFDANRKGFFGGCRQFVGLDCCFLKGLYKGVLLSAVSIDANYGIYPLAVCVAENENTESWVYFMERLYEQIGCNDGEGLCFMSDRHKRILNALERVFTQALKRYCCKQKFPGLLLRKEFWQACRSANATQFKCHMAELYKISPAAHDWLMGIPVVCWAKHCFPTHTKCSHVTNNMTESFNNWIGNFRAMPILRMLEEIRQKIMTLIHKRQQQVLCWKDELPPIVRRRIMVVREESRSLQVIFGHNQTFEVMEDVSKRTTVDLLSKHCDCREWDVSGLPCKHAVCCIDAMRFNVDDYVHTLLKKTSFKNTYSHQLYPVPDESNCPLLLHDNLLPPMIIKTAGRPQTKRRKEAGEAKNFKRSSSVKCSRCDQWGHNKRGCKEPMRSLNVNKAEMKRRSSKKREESSGSVHCDDGSASRATFAGNISSTQSSVVGPAAFPSKTAPLLKSVLSDSDIFTSALVWHLHIRFGNLISLPLTQFLQAGSYSTCMSDLHDVFELWESMCLLNKCEMVMEAKHCFIQLFMGKVAANITVDYNGTVKKIRKPKPWKHPQPITKSQLMQLRDEFWDTAPHYGGRKASRSWLCKSIVDRLGVSIANSSPLAARYSETTVLISSLLQVFNVEMTLEARNEIWDALRAAAEADLSLAQAIVDSAGVIVQSADLTICYDERGAKYELPKYVLSEPTNLIREG
ncbi:mutator transposase mudra protein [Citrus sinensis]|nr:mutator transposase mudra protein [Citrus sinensis]